MYFTITTNRVVAEQIKEQCERDEKFNLGRSYELGGIEHHERFSIVVFVSELEGVEEED